MKGHVDAQEQKSIKPPRRFVAFVYLGDNRWRKHLLAGFFGQGK